MKTLSIASIVAALSLSACALWPGGSATPDPNPANVIASGSFSVSARTFKPFTVVVPEGASNARVEGTFSTTGGANNDVEVTLLEQAQFLNWQNRLKFLPVYESGRVTADKVKIPLPEAGTYIVVFNNRFSLLSSKTVAAELRLAFDR